LRTLPTTQNPVSATVTEAAPVAMINAPTAAERMPPTRWCQ
jgi:hypothetical protein